MKSRMFKKIVSALVCVTMIGTLLVGCGSSGSSDSDSSTATATNNGKIEDWCIYLEFYRRSGSSV